MSSVVWARARRGAEPKLGSERESCPGHSWKLGTSSNFSPAATVRFSPPAQTWSLSRSLNSICPFPLVADQSQVVSSRQSRGTPFSQLSPGPWPRINSALPNPTLILASIVVAMGRVCVVSVAVLFTGRLFGAGLTAAVLGSIRGAVETIRSRFVKADCILAGAAGFESALVIAVLFDFIPFQFSVFSFSFSFSFCSMHKM